MSGRLVRVMRIDDDIDIQESFERFKKKYEGIYAVPLESYKEAAVYLECYRLKQTVLSSNGESSGDIVFKYEAEPYPEWKAIQEELKQGREAIEKLKQLEKEGVI